MLESIGSLVDALCIENIKIFNLREQIHRKDISDEEYVKLFNNMNVLNSNRSILSNCLDSKIEKVVSGKEENGILKNIKTY